MMKFHNETIVQYSQLPLIASPLIGHPRRCTQIVQKRNYEPQTRLTR